MDINQLIEKSHEIAKKKGFWDNKRPISECLMLIVTELSEACEADREGNWKNFKEEIADTFIRLGDLCGYLEIDLNKEIQRKMRINEKRGYKHGKIY